jgi:hypothetical protein
MSIGEVVIIMRDEVGSGTGEVGGHIYDEI